MILEQNIPEFSQWIGGAAISWCISAGLLVLTALVIGAVWSIIQYGFKGFWIPFANAIQRGGSNLMLSPQRTWAIARLTIKESIRRRVLFVFVFFMLLLLVAGWFLDTGSEDPARLYLSFVLGATTVMILLLSLFLSAFSLPTDFKTKTIYTVVTKPVRSSELVAGRIVGIGFLGTVILLFMGIASFFFVTSGLQHTHLLTEHEDLTPVSAESEATANEAQRVAFQGLTRLTNGHKHPVKVFADGHAVCEPVNGHTHPITVDKRGDQTRYTVENERGTMQARKPVYGRLSYRKGDEPETHSGINVGDEWEYRSYIAGATAGSPTNQSAVFAFSGISDSLFSKETLAKGLPVEMTVGVMRTVKGNIEERVTGNLLIRNPKTGLRVEVGTFSTEEFITKTVTIPVKMTRTPMIVQRHLTVSDGQTSNTVSLPSDAVVEAERKDPNLTERREFDFFKDFVVDGNVEIWLQCIDNMQYLGVSQRDLYFRVADASVELNFVKGYFGIWMQMIALTAFGVMFSTFLSGTVALVSTMAIMVIGFSKAFFIEIGWNRVLGGGPFESFYRLMIQQNMVTDLPNTFSTSFIKVCDQIFSYFLLLIGQAIPPLSDYAVYGTALISGFNIPGDWLLNHGVMTLAYSVPIFIAGYLILSNREVAKS
ncbi:ABC transporter permease [Planctomycetales bacterium]|nr:ABC transporter permease [Planctomycetales bacterium]